MDLRVAVLRYYFLRIQKKLRNPAIVEIKILRQTQDSAIYDELTRLHNYRYFQDRVTSECGAPPGTKPRSRLMMIDADDFKAFNDPSPPRRQRRPAAAGCRPPQDGARGGRGGPLRRRGVPILLPSTPSSPPSRSGEGPQAIERARIGARDTEGPAPHGEHRGGERARRRGNATRSSWTGPTGRSTSRRAWGRTA